MSSLQSDRSSSTAPIGDAFTNWSKYESVLRDKWQILTTKCLNQSSRGCMYYKQTMKDATHSLLDVEENSDGYIRIRWPGTFEPAKTRKRKSRGREYNQTYYPRKAMYIHHLSYFIANGVPAQDITRCDFSHLCHDRKCFNPEHIVYERHTLNIDRQYCVRRAKKCDQHRPPCLFVESQSPNQIVNKPIAEFKEQINIKGVGI